MTSQENEKLKKETKELAAYKDSLIKVNKNLTIRSIAIKNEYEKLLEKQKTLEDLNDKIQISGTKFNQLKIKLANDKNKLEVEIEKLSKEKKSLADHCDLVKKDIEDKNHKINICIKNIKEREEVVIKKERDLCRRENVIAKQENEILVSKEKMGLLLKEIDNKKIEQNNLSEKLVSREKILTDKIAEIDKLKEDINKQQIIAKSTIGEYYEKISIVKKLQKDLDNKIQIAEQSRINSENEKNAYLKNIKELEFDKKKIQLDRMRILKLEKEISLGNNIDKLKEELGL